MISKKKGNSDYIKCTIVAKEILYFDTHKTGELNTKLTDNIDKIHDGIGDKLGLASQFIAAFITGLALGKFNV